MRKTATVTITAEGRDQNKVFLLREMPAMKAEKWAMRALAAMVQSGVEIPDEIVSAGLQGVAALGLRALFGVPFDVLSPLLDELLECVTIQPDPSKPAIQRPLIEDDIEEVSTLIYLRAEAYSLHVNFSRPAAKSNLTSATGEAGSS